MVSMIVGDDVLSDELDDAETPKDADGMMAVDLHLDDDEHEPRVAAKLQLADVPIPTAPPEELSLPQKISIAIKDYEKKGEGMSAYIVYKVVSKTQNILGYSNQEYVVWRRFSDFLGLHEKLMEKYFCKGYLVAAPPEKSIAALTKTKMNTSVDEHSNNCSDFAERRARELQRFCRRIARHPKLVSDCDFRDFLTLNAPLPRANNTAAFSGAGVMRIFKTVGDVFSKMAFHMDENDRWFEATQQQMDDNEQNLIKLLRAVETMSAYRRDLIGATDAFSKALSMLASCEENTSLARTLSHLTETYENIEQLHGIQAEKDCALFAEAINEQLQVIYTFKDLFFERVKVWQNWQAAQQNLTRKREIKARHELSGRTDRVNLIMEELSNAEKQVDEAEKDFAEFSNVVRDEYKMFMVERKKDIHEIVENYFQGLLQTQKKLLQYWETFAPETQMIATA